MRWYSQLLDNVARNKPVAAQPETYLPRANPAPDRPTISFGPAVLTPRRFSLDVKVAQQIPVKLWFEWNQDIPLHHDQIALALSTFCLSKYAEIGFDFPVSAPIAEAIANYARAKVTAPQGVQWPQRPRANTALNFSGGFDSLAAKYVMPDDTRLISMDFGGNFARERLFFEQFDPLIVSTNLVDLGLHRGQWAFMGIGAILACDISAIETHVFGSILEAGPDNFKANPPVTSGKPFPPFGLSGLQALPYVAGLSEIGTVMVIGHYAAELVAPALDSCAIDGEEKRYRKQILAQIVERQIGKDFALRIVPAPAKPYFKFGKSFALDFLSLYILKHAGVATCETLLTDIPPEARHLASTLSLDFYEKFNPVFLKTFPPERAEDLLQKLQAAGISLYTDADIEEFAKVRGFLQDYYAV